VAAQSPCQWKQYAISWKKDHFAIKTEKPAIEGGHAARGQTQGKPKSAQGIRENRKKGISQNLQRPPRKGRPSNTKEGLKMGTRELTLAKEGKEKSRQWHKGTERNRPWQVVGAPRRPTMNGWGKGACVLRLARGKEPRKLGVVRPKGVLRYESSNRG